MEPLAPLQRLCMEGGGTLATATAPLVGAASSVAFILYVRAL